MKRTQKKKFIPGMLTSLLAVMLAVSVIPSEGMAASSTVDLGTASSFGVLAGSAITNTGPTTISGTAGGDIGLHPGDDPTIATFPGQESITLSGAVHLFDAVAEEAKADLVTAYNDAAGRTTEETITADLGGTTLTPGVYTSDSSIAITGTLTLDAGGDPNAVFIFQAGSTLTTATNSEVRLINNANPCRIFWQVGSSATLGTGSYFAGHILAMESITATNEAEIDGQLLARNGAVTLDTNTITNVCTFSGSLSITKDVRGSVGNMTLPEFELTVVGPEDFSATRTFDQGESYTWTNLVPGEYTVTENRSGLSREWRVAGEGAVVVTAGEMAITTITNSYITRDEPSEGALTVSKVVAGDIDDMVLPLFEITVTGPEGFSATRTFVHGESYTWDSLTPGEYTITENQSRLSDEWTVSGEGTVLVTENQRAINTITNTFVSEEETNYGTLTLSKVVVGDIGDMTLPLFEITVTGPAGFSATRTFIHGEAYTWLNLTPGIYTVTENRAGLSSEWTVSEEGTVWVLADQIAQRSIINEYEKSVVNDVEDERDLPIPLPDTGGSFPWLTYSGVTLFGISLLLWRRWK